MRVVIAPDCFTGTLTAAQAATAMADGWREGAPHDEVVRIPLSDGGPGFLDVLGSGLADSGVETLIVVGGSVTGSVDDTTRQGAAHGYRMLLVSDAIYPLNSPHLESLLTRADCIDTAGVLELIGREHIPLLEPLMVAAR